MSVSPPRRPPPAVQRVVSGVLKAILGSPAHGLLSRSLIILAVTGRKSGRRYELPVAYGSVGQRLLVVTNGTWAPNLRGGAPIQLLYRGSWRQARAELVEDEAAARAELVALLRAVPATARFLGVRIGQDGSPAPDDIQAAFRAGWKIVRITPDYLP